MSENEQEKSKEILFEKVREIEEQKAAPSDEQENTSVLLGERRRLTELLDDAQAKRRMSSYSRRGFLIGGAAAVFGYLSYDWLKKPENGWIFERTFRLNENIGQLYYSPKNLAPEFSFDQVSPRRVNGMLGMETEFDAASWKLQLLGVANQESYLQYTDNIIYDGLPEAAPTEQKNAPQPPQAPAPGLLLSLDDIRALPRVEMTTELKCIEGWSVIVNWAGARFSDFVQAFKPKFTKYVSLVTPDFGYYVGWDMPSILHPQTLLVYEMNGAPLLPEHGAPLRLASPTKYGIKQIKRIGRIEFTDTRPADYWAAEGYDWYSGH